MPNRHDGIDCAVVRRVFLLTLAMYLRAVNLQQHGMYEVVVPTSKEALQRSGLCAAGEYCEVGTYSRTSRTGAAIWMP